MYRPNAHIKQLKRTNETSQWCWKLRVVTTGIVVATLLLIISCVDTRESRKTEAPPTRDARGKAATVGREGSVVSFPNGELVATMYAQHCALCHGDEGREIGRASCRERV